MRVSVSICVYLPLWSQFLKNPLLLANPRGAQVCRNEVWLKHLWVGLDGKVGKFCQVSSRRGSRSTERSYGRKVQFY